MTEIIAIVVAGIGLVTSIISFIFSRKDRSGDKHEEKFKVLTVNFNEALKCMENKFTGELKTVTSKFETAMEKVDTQLKGATKESQEIKYNYLTRFGNLERLFHEMELKLVTAMNDSSTSLRELFEDNMKELTKMIHKGD